MAKKIELTEDNYFSSEMAKKYMSVSQLKNFIGMPFLPGCESRAMAELNGEYVRDKSDALLVGSYVDIALTGTKEEMEKFMQEHHTEMFSSKGETKGQLKSQYRIADTMISRVKNDEFMMKTLNGEHQVIMTGNIYGVDFKVKIDSLLENAIVDLKTTEDIHKTYYDPVQQRRVSFVEYYDYITQGAIYQEIVRQNTGKTLPFFLTVVDKTKVPDIAVLQIDNDSLADRLAELEEVIKSVDLIKKGKVEPIGCGMCDYCKSKKVLNKPISWLEIGGELP